MAKVDFTCSIEACAAHYGDDVEAVKTYMIEGQEWALTLDNRGPIRSNDGNLHPDIADAYSKYGVYVFEGVIGEQELADSELDLEELRSRFPTGPGRKWTRRDVQRSRRIARGRA